MARPLLLSGGFLLIVFCAFAVPARAHLLNMTEVRVEVDGASRVRVLLELDLTREFGSSAAYFRFSQRPPGELLEAPLSERWARLASAIEVRQPGAEDAPPVSLQVAAVRAPVDFEAGDFESPFVWPRTEVELTGTVDRRFPVQLVFSNRFRFEEPIATRMVDTATDLRRSRWLVANQGSPRLPLAPVAGEESTVATPWAELWSYGRAGFMHILPLGLDHLVFVLLLFLAAHSLRDLVLQVSVFTVAHSVTLALASYRVVEVPAALVEPLIALSIAWVAVENLRRPRPGAARLAVVFAFGLLHGLGFASALADLALPQSHTLLVLLAFNGGVEVGQLTFLAGLAVLLGWYRQARAYRRRVVVPLSALSALLAGFWLVQRL
ncbi:HupE/UreJ family protein [Pseudohaliea rubra]|uniref:HupE/UreJ family protein n=1 Tax=Pseudohaliea rubra DSM 19751 TaxID=1265313 RepID=A0A095XXF5_9GAMM|nr:HupE/UreJ family protein [Pseudohaliea rubra]KGE04406.1 hypothetical protein HRUBRA_00990 [Pseudohaliea rubra DSM 19751]